MTRATERRPTRILARGDWMDESGAIVAPDVPAALRGEAVAPQATRLDLARWIVGPDNALTARVLVNRLWYLFFGRGLATPLDDVGSQGQPPTHPELLDWLAAQLIDSGWDVRHVIRLILTSATYRQESAPRPELDEVDPEGRLWARQRPRRLDAESIRDNALAVSGLLSETVGGPSVKPYQPAGYWGPTGQVIPGSPASRWRPSRGAAQYRRGLYTYWKRNFLHPSLLAFDAPTREECVAERNRSNTPQQALVLLNDPTQVEAARVLAGRAAAAASEPRQRAAWIYRQVLARDPEPRVLAALEALYGKHLEEFRRNPDAIAELGRVGQAAKPERGGTPHWAATVSVCRAVLNLYETVTRL